MDIEQEKALLAKYPFHIYLLVKLADEALASGRARIENGMLIMLPDPAEELPVKPPSNPVDSSPTGR